MFIVLSAAVLVRASEDVLVVSGGMGDSSCVELKAKLKGIAAMLTRLALRLESVSDSQASYGIDYEHEHDSPLR